MTTYRVPVTYTSWGLVEVEANSLDEAVDKCLKECGLPKDAEYVDDSMKIDDEGLGIYND